LHIYRTSEDVVQKLAAGLILLSLATIPQLLHAEMTGVTMRDAIGAAIVNNRNLKAAAFERSAAELKVRASRAGYFPQLMIEESGVYTNSATKSFMMRLDEGRFSLAGDLNNPPSSGDFRTSLLLEQPLYDRQISTALSMATNEQGKSVLSLQRRREEIAYKTVSAYLDVQQAKTRLKLSEDSLAASREHQRLAVVRNSAGVGLKSDELRAKTFVAEMEQQLISARNGVEIAQLRLAQAVGRDSGEKLDTTEEFRAPPLVKNQSELMEQALRERSELKEMQKSVEQAQLSVDAARNGYWPTAQAVAGYQMNDHAIPFGRENDSWMVGATLRWKLFEGGRTGNEADRASALKSSEMEYLAEQRQAIGLQVTETYLRREELGKRLEVARQSVLEAEETVRLLTKRFENSLALIVELLDAQTILNRARGNVAELEAEHAKSWARLLFVSGSLLKEIE
jgi:outer membrane protein TolC